MASAVRDYSGKGNGAIRVVFEPTPWINDGLSDDWILHTKLKLTSRDVGKFPAVHEAVQKSLGMFANVRLEKRGSSAYWDATLVFMDSSIPPTATENARKSSQFLVDKLREN